MALKHEKLALMLIAISGNDEELRLLDVLAILLYRAPRGAFLEHQNHLGGIFKAPQNLKNTTFSSKNQYLRESLRYLAKN